MKLLDMLGNGVEITNGKKKMVFNNETIFMPVYRINLDLLYYNDQNDRISTWLNKFEIEGNKLPELKSDEYNSIIEEFIEQSNPIALNKTKKNIDLVGQNEPGVVLNDGRIIDGNRRYTCLRKLQKEHPKKTRYFESVILEKDIESSSKEIKLLELFLQHGKEERVDYSPIDKLVGLYKDVIKNKLITIEEYANTTNSTINEIKKKVNEAILMVEFLEYINADEEFYIARELNLDGPLQELQGILRNVPEDKEYDIKTAVFNILAVGSTGDTTRTIRRIKNIAKYPKYLEQFIEEQKNVGIKILDTIGEDSGRKALDKISMQSELAYEVKKSLNKADESANLEKAKNVPLSLIEKVEEYLMQIDLNIVKQLSEENRAAFCLELKKAKENMDRIWSEIDVQR
ncbi:Uncharacterised protein [Faecalicoccus pleomorphus]|uniref:ParB/Sulfiredoxin domain-containing protein n=1 Tax=Faecalicoccus pleomorphus TaxID=1323 RepID=A0A380LIZ1_9FIRM|nr:hypothetical protein [Faecalicoccus pleomorphus]SUO03197.1 Uncharacterised protein [Faecalicoccus pleomorphus]